MNKIYKYGVLEYEGTTLWDFLGKEKVENRDVLTYNDKKDWFTVGPSFNDSDYNYIIKSSNISYEMFKASPKLAIVLLKEK